MNNRGTTSGKVCPVVNSAVWSYILDCDNIKVIVKLEGKKDMELTGIELYNFFKSKMFKGFKTI